MYISIGSSIRRNFTCQVSRKLLLISLDWRHAKDPVVSLGQASLLATLRRNGVAVLPQSYAINHADFNARQVSDFIMSQAGIATDVAIGAFVWNEHIVKTILESLKSQEFPGRIILGGPQISYVKLGLERYYPQVDVFIRGYAENSLSQLLQTPLSGAPIPGVYYAGRRDDGMFSSLALEHLPSPLLAGIIKPQSFLRWETKRGCPYQCSFCQHRGGEPMREFSWSRIHEEINFICRHVTINDVAVVDPTFNVGQNYLHVLKVLARNKFAGKLSLQCRLENVSQDFLNAVELLNSTAKVTLEFGLQTINPLEQKVISRPTNMEKVARVLSDVRTRQINTEVSLIYGLPHQTLDSFRRSVAFCVDYNVASIRAFPLMLLRGTQLYEQKEELGLSEGYVDEIDGAGSMVSNFIPLVTTSPTFSYLDWLKMRKIANDLEVSYNQVKKIEYSRLVDSRSCQC